MAFRKRKNSNRSVASAKPRKRQQHQRSTNRPLNKSIRIPENLKDAIINKGKGLYELNFPIDSLDGLQRLAWGLDLRAETVSVCLKFPNGKESDFVCFCVHLSTDDEERQLRHRFCSTKGNDPIMSPCSPRSTILTCSLSRELYGLIGLRGCRDLAVIYDQVFKMIKSDPTKHCLICGKNFKSDYRVKLYTPTACPGDCIQKLDKWPLRARLSHVLSDSKTLDFLLCCIYTAVDGQKAVPDLYGTKDSLLVDCPLKLAQIQPAIDSLPPLSDKLSISDLLHSGSLRLKNARRLLLSWLSLRARGCMVSLKPGAELSAAGQTREMCHQFMLLNSVLHRQAAFAKSLKQVGVGSVGFHGCRASRAFNIITDALRDMSGKSYHVWSTWDKGIFLSNSPSYSYAYAATPMPPETPFRAWKYSVFGGQSWAVVFGLEVAMPYIPFRGSPGTKEFNILDEGKVMVRYVFLISRTDGSQPLVDGSSSWGIEVDHIIKQDVMKKAFKALDECRLNPQQIGLDVDRSGWNIGQTGTTGGASTTK
ncbi:hypothetical protein VM1G_01368 [Cytospora mali]|uniref:Uncharacterized protein n=1 Tax=Cytospora mali TaxID=578113 RepID=A0A194VRT8_CYTMA|nr:hypothetical protein VM1G_01368 [Valsa mali]